MAGFSAPFWYNSLAAPRVILVSRTRSLIPSDPTQAWQVACGHHEALLNALQRRDAKAARLAMREDLSALGKIDGYWEGIEDGAGSARDAGHERQGQRQVLAIRALR